ncbi:MAG: hypothetical protein AAF696_20460 [Bacteroidota bacterium]
MKSYFLLLCILSLSCLTHAQEPMKIKDWERPYFKESFYDPSIFLIVYGEFEVDFEIDGIGYQMKGIPEGIDLMQNGPDSHPEVLKDFLSGYLWEELQEKNIGLAELFEQSSQGFIIRGTAKDTNTLNYFRDIVGLSTYLLDKGGIGIYDPLMFRFWSKGEWKQKVVEGHEPKPREHVMILFSEEEGGTLWYHTRGMIKYGRPDLSVHGVKAEDEVAVQDLINRFIELQAFGGVIRDGQKIKMKTLPDGMWCENRGSFEDPDFNNKYVEIHWK